MRTVRHIAIGLLCTAGLAATDTSAAQIKAGVISAPASLQAGQAVDVALDRYWRGNMKVDASGLHDNKKDFPHVPSLIEYRVKLEAGGEYELQAKYLANGPCPTHLTIDGDAAKMQFKTTGDHQKEWATLDKRAFRPGTHAIRFTSQYVETPFPLVTGLRLVFHGGSVPSPEPEPPIVGPRPSLPEKWYKSLNRKIHGDFHTAAFIRGVGKHFDGEAYGRTLADSGVTGICIFAKGHHGFCFYNTKVGTRHPGLDFDLMKAQIEACHKHGIAVWTYFSIEPDELYSSTEEQTVKDPDDRPTKIKIDAKTPYVTDYLWPMIAECVRGYDLDGIFFDFPVDEAFVQGTIKLIRKTKPGLVVAYNHQWGKSRDELRELDVLEIESWQHKQPLYHWQYFARYARGAVPLTAMTIRFWKSWGDFGGLTDESALRYHAATALANGCGLTVGDHLHPYGRLDPAVYKRISAIFRDVAKIEPYVTDSESIPYVALLRPLQVPLTGADNACHALIDAGLHFTIIDPTQDPKPFAAVVVPDGSMVDTRLASKLRDYVEGGGRLLVTGKPGPELTDLLGIRPEPATEAAYIRVDPRILPTPPVMDVFTYLNVVPAVPTEGTELIAPLVWQMNHRTIHVSRRQSPPNDEVSGLAAITSRTLGKGQAVYTAAPLLEIYAVWGYTPMRQILVDLLDRMIPPAQRLAQVRAPVNLEVSLNRQGNRVIVHLVHYPQSRRSVSTFGASDYVNQNPIIDEVPTVSGAKLSLAESLVGSRTIKLLPAGVEIKAERRENGVVTIDLPDFQISAVLVVE